MEAWRFTGGKISSWRQLDAAVILLQEGKAVDIGRRIHLERCVAIWGVDFCWCTSLIRCGGWRKCRWAAGVLRQELEGAAVLRQEQEAMVSLGNIKPIWSL